MCAMKWLIKEEEKKIVDELKRRTINDVTPKMLEDEFLFYRFCKARDFNLTAAEDMLRKHIAWRREQQFDTIMTDYVPPEVLKKYFSTNFLCFDKEGCPVRYSDLGQLDLKGLWNSVRPIDVFKFLLQEYQRDENLMNEQIKKLRKPVTKSVYIHNLEHFKLSSATDKKTLQFIINSLKVYIDNCPERQKCAVIINASAYFTWLYSILKPILPASIIQSTKVYSSDGWKEELLDLIDPEDLPVFLGGNRTDSNGDPMCKSFLKHGQVIPESYYLRNIEKKLSLESDVKLLTVRAFSKEHVSLQVQQTDCVLRWEFEMKDKDIEFSVHFRDETQEDSRSVEVIPKQRVETCYESEKGSFKCDNMGLYTFVFDNSYSWLHTKEIYYRLSISEPNDSENL